MTEERLLQIVQERAKPQTFATLAKYFCVSESAISRVLNKLESEGHVRYELKNGKKYWSATVPKIKQRSDPKPEADPVAVPASRVYRIEDGENRAAAKPRTKTPTQPQSWFSVLGK